MARLDRLGPAKELAQIGAAIGRQFSHALLASVLRKPEAELGSALDRLIEAGLLFRQGMPPHATYLFKHALVQDAAYGTLLREQCRRQAGLADTRFSREQHHLSFASLRFRPTAAAVVPVLLPAQLAQLRRSRAGPQSGSPLNSAVV